MSRRIMSPVPAVTLVHLQLTDFFREISPAIPSV